MTDWATHLTELSAEVERVRAALRSPTHDDQSLEVVGATPPATPLGPEDAAQARTALATVHALVQELTAARDRVRKDLVLSRRLAAGSTARSGATYHDSYG